MTDTVYFTLFIVSAIFICNGQLLPDGVPLFHGGYLERPLNQNYKNVNTVPKTVGVPSPQKFFTRGVSVLPSLTHRMPASPLKLGVQPGLGMSTLNTPQLQLRSTNAKENATEKKPAIITDSEKFHSPPAVEKKLEAILQQMKKAQKHVQQNNNDERKPVSSIDPIDQKTDEMPKEVLGSSGTFSDGSRSSVQLKPRSPQNGQGIPDLDYLSKAANPIGDWEKKIEKTVKNIGHEIKHTFQEIPKIFQDRADEISNIEVSAPYNNYQHENYGMKPVLSTGLKMTMDDFQKTLSQSQLMQKYYGNQRTDSNQYSSKVNSYQKQANSAGNFWDFAASPVNNVADSLIKGGQPRTNEAESGVSSSQQQESNSKIITESTAAVEGSSSEQQEISADFWQTLSEYVSRYGNNQFLGESNPRSYGYGYRGYPVYYENVRHGHRHENHDHHEHHHNHKHHEHNNWSYYPYYQGYYQNGYYPMSDWHYENGYYKINPAQVENLIYSDGLEDSMSGGNLRQMPWSQETIQPAQSKDITNSALILARNILAGKPDQIVNAGVNAETGIVGVTNQGHNLKRSDSVKAADLSLWRNPRQVQPMLPLAALMLPVRIGIDSAALNFAQGFTSTNSNQSVIQPIATGFGESARNLAQGLRLRHDQALPTQELPAQQLDQVGQIDGSVANVVQEIMRNNPSQTVNSGTDMGIEGAGNFFKGSNWTEPQNSKSTRILNQFNGGITNSALNLAQSILSGNPDQIAYSGINMGTGITGTELAAPRFFYKRSDSTESHDVTSSRILRQMPTLSQGWTQFDGGITNSALNLAQGILSGNRDQIANSGVNMGMGIVDTGLTAPHSLDRSGISEPQNPTSAQISKQIPPLSQGWTQSDGGISNSALNLAEGIVSGNPSQIANSGINVGAEITGTGLTAPRFFYKRSDSTQINADQIIGAAKDGGNVLPSDLIWESVTDLAGNIAKVTKKPTILGKVVATSNSPVNIIIKSPNQLANAGHSQFLGATKSSGQIVNSPTTLASRVTTQLANPNVFGNSKLDSADYKSASLILNPVYMAGDIMSASLNPKAYRNMRMLKSYAPTQVGGYVQTSIPAIAISQQKQTTIH